MVGFSKSKRKQKLLFLAFLLMISLGYAVLSTNMQINGTSKLNNSTWDIHFENLVPNADNVTLSNDDIAAAITAGDSTEVTYSVTLKNPGDFYEFIVDAVNAGTVDGMVDVVTSTYKEGDNEAVVITDSNLPPYLSYSVTYSTGKPILRNHELKAGESETYLVRVEFKRDIDSSDLPSTAQTILFNFGVNYKQADSNAVSPSSYQYSLGRNVSIVNGSIVNNNAVVYSDSDDALAEWEDEEGVEVPFYLKYKLSTFVGWRLMDGDSVIRDKFTSLSSCQNYSSNPNYSCSQYYERNIIQDPTVDFIISSTDVNADSNLKAGTYSLQGGSGNEVYQANKATLLEAFGSNNCHENVLSGPTEMGCSSNNMSVYYSSYGYYFVKKIINNTEYICSSSGTVFSCYKDS